MIRLREGLEGARFLSTLPRFLRRPIMLDEARNSLRHRFRHRADDFLQLAREVIFRHTSSPYRQLLALAGCEYGDLEQMVRREGLESALATLARHGVYLTVDELKGRRPIVRGATTHRHAARRAARSRGNRPPLGPHRREPRRGLARVHRSRLRPGSSGGHVPGVRGSRRCRLGARRLGVPGGSSVVVLLEFGAFGGRTTRWFSQIDPRLPDLPPRYRWSARVMRWGSVGAPDPNPGARVRPAHRAGAHPPVDR